MAAIIKHLSSPFEGFALFVAQKLSEREASVQSVGAYACGCNMRIKTEFFVFKVFFSKDTIMARHYLIFHLSVIINR